MIQKYKYYNHVLTILEKGDTWLRVRAVDSKSKALGFDTDTYHELVYSVKGCEETSTR